MSNGTIADIRKELEAQFREFVEKHEPDGCRQLRFMQQFKWKPNTAMKNRADSATEESVVNALLNGTPLKTKENNNDIQAESEEREGHSAQKHVR